MTQGQPLGSRVFLWLRGLYRNTVRTVFLGLLLVSAGSGYAVSRGWLQLRLNLEEFVPHTDVLQDDALVGTGLGATGRGRAYGIFVALSEFPPDEHGASRNLPGHQHLARHVADAFIGTHIIRSDDAIVLQDESATLESFREAVVRLTLAVTNEDLVIIYFATHGGENSLELRGGSLSEAELQGDLSLLHPAQGLFIADACRSGSLDHATPFQVVGGVLWNRLYSTGETTFSYGEYMSNALIDVVPLLGSDDGRVTFGDLMAAVQDHMHLSELTLTEAQREQMRVNGIGERDAMLWHARSLPIDSRE